MRIIGGHDYYDSGLAFGQDEAIVFLRNGNRRATSDEMIDRFHLPYGILGASLSAANGEKSNRRAVWNQDTNRHRMQSLEIKGDGRVVRYEIAHAQVVLCGRLHRGIRIEISQPYGPHHQGETHWFWKADALRAFAAGASLTLDEGVADIKQLWLGSSSTRRRWDVPIMTLEQWFTPTQLEGAAMDALITERVTIAYRTPEGYPPRNEHNEPLTWVIDQVGLREMDFAKAVDPYTAFQEIAMWKGGVLPSDGPAIVEITDDKVKIAKAGFHHPTSFRRAKTG